MAFSLIALRDTCELVPDDRDQTEEHNNTKRQKVMFPSILFQVQVNQHVIRRLNEHYSWKPVVQVPIS